MSPPALSGTVAPPDPTHNRPRHGHAVWSRDQASEAILDILPQIAVRSELCRLRTFRPPIGVPLSVDRPVLGGSRFESQRSTLGSREIVDGERSSRRAISRTLSPQA
jgi:hypothetical protein